MSSYYFISVPVKATIDPTPNVAEVGAAGDSLRARVPQRVFNSLLRRRTAVLRLLHDAQVRPQLLDGDSGAVWLDELRARLHTYASDIAALEKAEPAARSAHYFYWGESLAKRENVAFHDTLYDLVNLHFNVGALELQRAQRLVAAARTELMLEAAEKGAYSACCAAAGHFAFVREHVGSVDLRGSDGTNLLDMPHDIRAPFAEVLEAAALGQAQEIGAARAAHAEENKGKELLPRLCHRVVELYSTALDRGTKRVTVDAPRMEHLLRALRVKTHFFRAVAHAYAGAFVFEKKENHAAGLWLTEEAQRLSSSGARLARDLSLAEELGTFLSSATSVVDALSHRVNSTNRLVIRAKAGEGPYPLPPPQPLARPHQPATIDVETLPTTDLDAPVASDATDEETGFVLAAHPEDH